MLFDIISGAAVFYVGLIGRERKRTMNLLTMEGVSKLFTDRVLFNNASLGINEGDKIGVLGINGTGKSTLLKMIAGMEEPDEGSIIQGKKVRIAYLPQTPLFEENLSILDNVIKGKKAEEEYRNLEGEARAMLERLGIENVLEYPTYLSGGQKKRAALVRTLLIPAEILVLDEPTNHLDHEMAEWLESYLNKYKGAFVMVTHDRYFLDKVTNKIVEIDKGKLYSYIANYSKFVELKAQREEMELATERKNKSLYRMELEWIMRGARARSTKQKAHIERFEQLRDREKIQVDKSVEINSLSSRLGRKTIEMNGISKSFAGNLLIKNFTYILLPGDRIGIIGSNGCGKSTLLKIMNGILEPDEGCVERGQTVKVGYFSQENEDMDESKRVIDYIREAAEVIQTVEGTITASQMLEKFLFTGAMQYAVISKLSGGEKRRLYLLRILMGAPNVLILDEPTNDLDIATLTILENYLESFDGIVVTVSHDRYFLDKMVQRIFAFEGNGVVRQYEGNFSDYKAAAESRGQQPIQEIPVQAETTSRNTWRKKEEKPKFTYLEKKEYESIDDEIANLEACLEGIREEMDKNATDYGKLRELAGEKDEKERILEEKMERWVYLNDLAEKIVGAGGRI